MVTPFEFDPPYTRPPKKPGRMTFDEAHEHLNHGAAVKVAEAMAGWHPAILGQMLIAISVAKQRRYPGPHADFEDGFQYLASRKDGGRAS